MTVTFHSFHVFLIPKRGQYRIASHLEQIYAFNYFYLAKLILIYLTYTILFLHFKNVIKLQDYLVYYMILTVECSVMVETKIMFYIFFNFFCIFVSGTGVPVAIVPLQNNKKQFYATIRCHFHFNIPERNPANFYLYF